MNMEDKALDCGYVVVDAGFGQFDLFDENGKMVFECVPYAQIVRFIANKSRLNPILQAKALVATLPLPEIDCDPEPFGGDE